MQTKTPKTLSNTNKIDLNSYKWMEKKSREEEVRRHNEFEGDFKKFEVKLQFLSIRYIEKEQLFPFRPNVVRWKAIGSNAIRSKGSFGSKGH